MVHGTQGGVDRGGEIKDLILDILREMFVVKPEGWHPDFQVFVADQRVGVGVGGGGVGTGSHRGPRVGGRWLRGECNGARCPLTGGGGVHAVGV